MVFTSRWMPYCGWTSTSACTWSGITLEFNQPGLTLRGYLRKGPLQALLHAMDEGLAPVLRTTWYWHEKTMFRLLLYSTRVCIRPQYAARRYLIHSGVA